MNRLSDEEKRVIIDKGTDHILAAKLKRAAKGNLYRPDGKVGAIFSIVTTGQAESLGYVTQFAVGNFAKDLQSGRIDSYIDQIVIGSGFANMTFPNLIMICVGLLFLYLAIKKDYEPLLLVRCLQRHPALAARLRKS